MQHSERKPHLRNKIRQRVTEQWHLHKRFAFLKRAGPRPPAVALSDAVPSMSSILLRSFIERILLGSFIEAYSPCRVHIAGLWVFGHPYWKTPTTCFMCCIPCLEGANEEGTRICLKSISSTDLLWNRQRSVGRGDRSHIQRLDNDNDTLAVDRGPSADITA